jgi:hypothetical protein
MGNRTTLLIFGVGVVALGGCDARSLTTDGGTGSGGSGEMTGGAGTFGTAGTAGTAGGAETCPADCSTPAGNVHTFTSTEEIYAAMAGLWQICAGAGRTYPTAPADTIGVEYTLGSAAPTANGGTVGGNMYYLVQGANGPVRAPNSGFGGSFRYSPCPREWEIGSLSPPDRAILAPF